MFLFLNDLLEQPFSPGMWDSPEKPPQAPGARDMPKESPQVPGQVPFAWQTIPSAWKLKEEI